MDPSRSEPIGNAAMMGTDPTTDENQMDQEVYCALPSYAKGAPAKRKQVKRACGTLNVP